MAFEETQGWYTLPAEVTFRTLGPLQVEEE
jgi:hypothetical protein